MSKWTTPFRYDYVESSLHPGTLKQAKADWSAGRISHEELRKTKGACITDLIEKQEALGYRVITDGEFRRSYQHLDLVWGLNDIEKIELDHGYYSEEEETTHGSRRMTGRIGDENHPIIQGYLFVKQFEDENTIAKQTLSTPAQTPTELFREDSTRITRKSYLDERELPRDLTAAYHRAYLGLYAVGCRSIQLDDCTWGIIADEESHWKVREGSDAILEQEAERYLKVNNLSLEGLPEDLVANTHICHGNYRSTYASSDPYDRVAPYVFAQENVHAFYLEFSDKCSSNFVSLKEIPRDRKVVLGLITSKRPELEPKELIKRRIHEAVQCASLRDLCLSPQYSFASCEIGNKLTEEERFARLRLVKEIMEKVWGKEEA